MSHSPVLTAGIPERAAWQRAAFSSAMLAATVLPLLAMSIAPVHPGVAPVIALLVMIGGAHVFSTSYLLTDLAVRRFVVSHPVKMGLIPLAMLICGTLAFSRPQSEIFACAVWGFCLYQTWHFGAQNIGVATFISLSERGKPLSTIEKRSIRLGVICGMMGVLRAMSPDFIVGAKNLYIGPVAARIFELFYIVGMVAACGLAAVALVLLIQAWRRQWFFHGLAIFLSITFLFSMYLSHDRTIGYLSFATARGLQYMIFLFWHSLGNAPAKRAGPSRRVAYIGGPAILLIVAVAGHFVWAYSPTVLSHRFPLIGLGFIMSITLAHFWIDQFLWRMKDKERARWVRERYGFIFEH
jgi:hypothetical protein